MSTWYAIPTKSTDDGPTPDGCGDKEMVCIYACKKCVSETIGANGIVSLKCLTDRIGHGTIWGRRKTKGHGQQQKVVTLQPLQSPNVVTRFCRKAIRYPLKYTTTSKPETLLSKHMCQCQSTSPSTIIKIARLPKHHAEPCNIHQANLSRNLHLHTCRPNHVQR